MRRSSSTSTRSLRATRDGAFSIRPRPTGCASPAPIWIFQASGISCALAQATGSSRTRDRKKQRQREESMIRDQARTHVLAVSLVVGALVAVAPSAQAQGNGPLVLAKSSYFFVGGKIDPSVEG